MMNYPLAIRKLETIKFCALVTLGGAAASLPVGESTAQAVIGSSSLLIPAAECAVITMASKNDNDVITELKKYRDFEPVAIRSNNGYTAAAVGIYPKADGNALVQKLKAEGIVPQDAYCGNSHRYVGLAYPNTAFTSLGIGRQRQPQEPEDRYAQTSTESQPTKPMVNSNQGHTKYANSASPTSPDGQKWVQACDQVDWTDSQLQLGFDVQFKDFWGESEQVDALRKQILASIEEQSVLRSALDIEKLRGRNVPDSQSNALTYAVWAWAHTYFDLKERQPDWGHIEWKTGALQEKQCAASDATKSCRKYRRTSEALDFINSVKLDFDGLADLNSGVANTMSSCIAGFDNLRPTLARALTGKPWSMCSSLYLNGVIGESMSPEEVKETSALFWTPKIPATIPLGEWGVVERDDNLLMIRIKDVQVIDSLSVLKRNYQLNEEFLYRWQKEGIVGGIIVTVDVMDASPPAYTDIGSSGSKQTWLLRYVANRVFTKDDKQISNTSDAAAATELYCGKEVDASFRLSPNQGVPTVSYAIPLTQKPNLDDMYIDFAGKGKWLLK